MGLSFLTHQSFKEGDKLTRQVSESSQSSIRVRLARAQMVSPPSMRVHYRMPIQASADAGSACAYRQLPMRPRPLLHVSLSCLALLWRGDGADFIVVVTPVTTDPSYAASSADGRRNAQTTRRRPIGCRRIRRSVQSVIPPLKRMGAASELPRLRSKPLRCDSGGIAADK